MKSPKRLFIFTDIPNKSWWCVDILPKEGLYHKNLKLMIWPIKILMDSGKNRTFKKIRPKFPIFNPFLYAASIWPWNYCVRSLGDIIMSVISVKISYSQTIFFELHRGWMMLPDGGSMQDLRKKGSLFATQFFTNSNYG